MKLTKKELQQIINSWEVGKIKDVKKAERGVVNHNWIVETNKEKFVLRGLPHNKKLSDLKFELKYIQYLKKKGFSYKLPLPLLSKNGEEIIRFKNNYFWIYGFLGGEIRDDFGKSELKEVAKMLASYHNILERSNLNNSKRRIDAFLRKIIIKEANEFKKNIENSKTRRKFDLIYLNELSKLMKILKGLDGNFYEKLKQYPVHRDPNPENIIWKDKKIAGLIDFDNVGSVNDALLKDIAIVLQLGCAKDGEKLNLKKAKYFIKEYKIYRKLSKKEIELLPIMISAVYIEDFNYAYWMLIHDSKRAKLYRLKKYSKVAQWYYNNREKIARGLR